MKPYFIFDNICNGTFSDKFIDEKYTMYQVKNDLEYIKVAKRQNDMLQQAALRKDDTT